MAGLIVRKDIDEVRARVNIAEVVGQYVALKSAGSGSLKGLCPFHDERSPSFHVRPAVGLYHCFGCGVGGDVFRFIMEMDHVTFAESVQRLAGGLGMELHYEDGGSGEDLGARARILKANAAAAEFYVGQLATPAASPGREFLGSRGFDRAAAELFGVGFAPRGSALGHYLREQGFSADDAVEAGLMGRGERGDVYDRFRGRLIWPIRDTTGQVLGFGARRLLDDDRGPKYLNTPETAVYHKSSVLYGIDLAKRDIAREKRVVVVEGYTDVMACHLAGVTTAVATCGTAFGSDHVTIVRRVMGDDSRSAVGASGEVIFTFDPDEAGRKAASRAFAEEARFAAQTFVAQGPDGLDPCDLRLQHGDAAVRRMVDERRPLFDFMIRRVVDAFDLETVEGRVGALRAAAPIVAGVKDQAVALGYSRELAGMLGADPAEVAQTVDRARRAPTAERTDAPRRAAASTDDTAGGGGDRAPLPVSISDLPTDPATRIERDVLQVLLQHPRQIPVAQVRQVVQTGFRDPTLAALADALGAVLDTPESATASAGDWVELTARQAGPGLDSLVRQLAVAPIPVREDNLAEYGTGIVRAMIDRSLLAEKRDLIGALQRAGLDADAERSTRIQRRLIAIDQERLVLRADS